MTEPDPGPLDIDPDAPRIRLLWWVVVALVVFGMGACVAKGANRPADPVLEEGARLQGFGEIGFRVQTDGGLPSTTELCALEAATEEQRARGLMDVTDPQLLGYDGMIFRFGEADTTTTFHMRDTPLALSVAWFDANGSFLGATDMAPCPDDVAECPLYAPPQPFRVAIEVPQGQLGALGIGPGTVLELLDDCNPRG